MCVFCELDESSKIYESAFYYVVFDIDPIQQGHLLIISKAHIMNTLELSDEAYMDLVHLERKLIGILEIEMGIDAVTIIRNNGKVMDDGLHFHEHIIPRYVEDGLYDNMAVEQVAFDQSTFLQKLNQLEI